MIQFAEADIRRALEQDNPWWQTGKQPVDGRLTYVRSHFEGFFSLATSWKIRRSVILMGPRRVGKTIMIRQLIARLIRQGFNPKRILFASIETPIYLGIPLEKFLEMFERSVRHSRNTRRVVIFDEIQYLKDWEVHLKVLTDRYPNTKFIASGSAAAALSRKSNESGAGRFTNFMLPPLTFAEFLRFTDLEKKLIKPKKRGRRYETTNIRALNTQFINYLNYGGYPEAVLNPEIQRNLRRFLGQDIVEKVLLQDLPSLYGIEDTQELNRLFAVVAYNSGMEISYDALASSSNVSKPTIRKYMEYLEAAFLIVRVGRMDKTGKTFERERNFKAYLTNPCMRTALFSPVSDSDTAVLGHLAETAIFSQWFQSSQIANIRYARWKVGRRDLEVDLVCLNPATQKPTWAYEVKWSDRSVKNTKELEGLLVLAKNHPSLPVGATTKTITAQTDHEHGIVKYFPCALHCYEIGRNFIEGKTD